MTDDLGDNLCFNRVLSHFFFVALLDDVRWKKYCVHLLVSVIHMFSVLQILQLYFQPKEKKTKQTNAHAGVLVSHQFKGIVHLW